MTPARRRFRLVIALDPSEYAEIVLEHAIDQAARRDQVDLHFITVVPEPGAIDDARERLARQALEGLDNLRGATTDWRSRLHVRVGEPAEIVAGFAADLDADLLVIGRFGVSAKRRKTPVVERILEQVACPTLVLGLGGRVVEAQPQCPVCVELREESDGERWFCDEHVKPDSLDLTLRLPSSTTSVLGGPLL